MKKASFMAQKVKRTHCVELAVYSKIHDIFNCEAHTLFE